MLFDDLVGEGKLIRPFGSPKVSGKFRVTQDFGRTDEDVEPRLGDIKHFHRGLDISDAKCGSPVFAAHAGTVKFANDIGNGELVVIINHGGGWGSSYGHLAAINPDVKKDVPVKAGQRIGAIGATGMAAGCHLHFGVKSDLPDGWNKLDFIPNAFGNGRGDTTGKWRNPWPLLVQNVTIHPKTDEFNINIRSAPDLDDKSIFAKTRPDGTIRRASDNVSLGATAASRKYGGSVTGAKYVVNGKPGTSWEKIELDGAFRYLATPYSERSAT